MSKEQLTITPPDIKAESQIEISPKPILYTLTAASLMFEWGDQYHAAYAKRGIELLSQNTDRFWKRHFLHALQGEFVDIQMSNEQLFRLTLTDQHQVYAADPIPYNDIVMRYGYQIDQGRFTQLLAAANVSMEVFRRQYDKLDPRSHLQTTHTTRPKLPDPTILDHIASRNWLAARWMGESWLQEQCPRFMTGDKFKQDRFKIAIPQALEAVQNYFYLMAFRAHRPLEPDSPYVPAQYPPSHQQLLDSCQIRQALPGIEYPIPPTPDTPPEDL